MIGQPSRRADLEMSVPIRMDLDRRNPPTSAIRTISTTLGIWCKLTISIEWVREPSGVRHLAVLASTR